MEKVNKNYVGLEIFSIVAALLVIANHISPLDGISENMDFLLARILARLAVPYFVMRTSYFSFNKIKESNKSLKEFVIKMLKIYLIAIAVYIPVLIYQGYFKDIDAGSLLKDILITGPIYHLWYFPALILGIVITKYMVCFLGEKGAFGVSIILYIIGLLGDSYYGLVQNVPALDAIYNAIFNIFTYTRSGLFMMPLFIMTGYMLRKKEGNKKDFVAFLLCISCMIVEGFVLKSAGFQRHDSMYIFLPLASFYLFKYLLIFKNEKGKGLQHISMVVYIVHILVIVFLRAAFGIIGYKDILVSNGLLNYILVSILSFISGYIALLIKNNSRKKQKYKN